MQQIELPKSYKERLDELEMGGNIPMESDEECAKFNAEMYRSFHKSGVKKFTIRKINPVKKVLFRLK